MDKFCNNLSEYSWRLLDAQEHGNDALVKEYENAIDMSWEELANMDNAKAWKYVMNFLTTNKHIISEREFNVLIERLNEVIKS